MHRVSYLVLFGFLALPVALPPVSAAAQTLPLAQQPALIQQFQKIEDSWSIALVNKDQFGLENLLAPAYIDVAASGAVSTRNERIADVLAGLPLPLLSVEQRVVNVRVVSDVAVVEGTYIIRTKEDGRTHDERGIFTHVYQRQRNTWSCISGQRTAVVEAAAAGARGKRASASEPGTDPTVPPQKKSNAPLPFHIPLLYKGKASTATSTSQAPAQAPPAPGSSDGTSSTPPQ
jgi:hypothetical protein